MRNNATLNHRWKTENKMHRHGRVNTGQVSEFLEQTIQQNTNLFERFLKICRWALVDVVFAVYMRWTTWYSSSRMTGWCGEMHAQFGQFHTTCETNNQKQLVSMPEIFQYLNQKLSTFLTKACSFIPEVFSFFPVRLPQQSTSRTSTKKCWSCWNKKRQVQVRKHCQKL